MAKTKHTAGARVAGAPVNSEGDTEQLLCGWLRYGPALLVALVVLVYWPWVRSEFIYDDVKLIVDQPAPKSFGDLFSVFGGTRWADLPYYRPLSYLSMEAQKLVFGPTPMPFHVANALLMGLVAWAMVRLLRGRAFRCGMVPALIGGAVLTLHPIASTTVFPVNGRETLLPTLFAILAVDAFLRIGGSKWRAPWAWVAYLAALLCKEHAVFVPLVLLAADAFGLTGRPVGLAGWVRRHAPFAIVTVLYFVLRGMAMSSAQGLQLAITERWEGPLQTYLYTLITVFAPLPALVYEPEVETWKRGVPVAIAFVVAAACAWWVHSLTRSVRQTESRRVGPWWLVTAVFALLPAANWVVQETRFAERYGFPVMVGVAGWLAWALNAGLRGDAVRGRRGLWIGAVLVVVLVGLTRWRATYYRDYQTFLSQWSASSSSAQAFGTSGGEKLARGDLAGARADYEHALSIRPDFARAEAGLGTVLAKLGKPAEALKHLQRAVTLDPSDAEAQYNLGVVQEGYGKFPEAERAYRAAIQHDAEHYRAHNALGVMYAKVGQFGPARREFEAAVRIEPTYQSARDNLRRLEAKGK